MASPVTELQSSSTEARPILPLVVSLKGRIGSSTIPLLDQYLALCCQSPHVILNLRAVDSVETSVAEYLQSQAERILQRQASPFSIVLSRSQSGVKGDLERGKVNYSCVPVTSPVADFVDLVGRKQLLAYESLGDAIRVARYGYQSSSCLLSAESNLSVSALWEVVLHRHSSSKPMFTFSELCSKGTTVRKLKYGETIACSEYPFPPAFIILDGRVVFQELHAASVNSRSRKCIRKAVSSAMQAVFKSERVVKDQQSPRTMEGTLYGKGPHIVAPTSPFCARVDSESCLILDIDPTHGQHCNRIVERAIRNGATKET